MIYYFASMDNPYKYIFPELHKYNIKISDLNILYSFYSFYKLKNKDSRNGLKFLKYANNFKDFLLDSGAFSFLNSKINIADINFDRYVDEYIDFIKQFKIKKFFELDIDSIIGYEKVKKIRYQLESIGIQPIPVWHKSRGLQDFINMCKEYKYVAIGGLVTKEIKIKEYAILKKLISISHVNGTKIHGLGFLNNFNNVNQYNFDTVDGTHWLSARFGYIYQYNININLLKMIKHNNKCLKNHKEATLHNFLQIYNFFKKR